MNISKGSIEVKERKKHERDYNDSDFVYPKVVNKTCKKTISHAKEVINDPEFETKKKDRSNLSPYDINQNLLCKDMEPEKQAVIKNIFQKQCASKWLSFFFSKTTIY